MPAPLSVIGLGPGDAAHLTPEARHHLERSRVIVGYSGYIQLLDPELRASRRIISTGMMGEMARAEAAIESAVNGDPTAVVCSGDPGIYALAGLILELLERRGPDSETPPLAVVPGVPAVCAAAALLGAPLMHDFACLSLSDLLTPAETILRRAEAAFGADFVVALYNPRSKRRVALLAEVLAIARRRLGGDAPLGVVRNACRPDQRVSICPLDSLDHDEVDMFTLLMVGNSQTRIVPGRGESPLAWECGARLLTPRGYLEKYGCPS